jgi:hypothetical protein
MTALRNQLSPEQLAELADKGEPEKARWSQLEQLIAQLYDRMSSIEYVLICSNVEKSKQPAPPEPMRRPGAGPVKRKAALTEKSADTLFQLLNGGAA